MTTRRHPTVGVVNHSTVVTDAEVTAAIQALQHQVTYHFEPHWNAGCTLLQVRAVAGDHYTYDVGTIAESAWSGTAASIVASLPAGAWLLTILDDSDQAGALGYHEVDPKDTPIGFVFAKTDQQAHLSWTVTASHELLEMLGDPEANLCVQVKADGTALAYETADAVEADEDGYTITTSGGPVLVSDFVLPAWFTPGSPGPWDYRGLCKAALELRAGGYIGVWRPGKGWTQVTAQDAPRHDQGPRFRMRAEGRGRADHYAGELPVWIEGGKA